MASTQSPPVVKYFIAALFLDHTRLNLARVMVTTLWGALDFEGIDHEFDVSDYYESEMGRPLLRRILAFEPLYEPTLLVDMKLSCNRIEEELSLAGKRTINLDAGYLDHNKVLLASAKEAGQKVYLDKGIYADLAGRYKSGKYRPFEWSFPDFKDGRYDSELLSVRSLYLNQVKKLRGR